MSIHAISGKPGGGKSLFALKALVNELQTTHRYIVTNLAVKQPELAAYLHKQFGQTFDLNQRLTVLDEEQTAKFWLYRGNGLVLPDQEKNDFSAADVGNVYWVPDAEKGQPVEGQSIPMRKAGGEGVCFILDELHLFFNAREWAKTGKAAIFYLSQHRKCNNDVIWITQHIENVDKQFRSLTQDFTYLRNYRQEKFMSAFQSLPWFSFKTFQSPVTASSGLMSPTEIGRFLLDAEGLAACYDTAKGVGFAGNVAADTKKPRRGLPLWVFGLVCVGLCIAAPVVVVGLTRYISHTVAFHPAKVLASLAHTNGPVSSPKIMPSVPTSNALAIASVQVTNAPVTMLDAVVALQKPFVPQVTDSNGLTMVGYAFLGKQGFIVALSDGRVLRSAKQQVRFIDENRCIVDGAWVYRRINPPAAPAAVPVSVNYPPVSVSTNAVPGLGPDRRFRKVIIHFGDLTVTNLVEPSTQTPIGESASESAAPADESVVSTKPAQKFT
ncbi:MAG TPA: zonular occludens toxin domain-containing protein, partial [Verrucomicrobiae bacterium]|nr:zonular occludens toxin domain-containing protein [Verrucomicrobiae bacterium]